MAENPIFFGCRFDGPQVKILAEFNFNDFKLLEQQHRLCLSYGIVANGHVVPSVDCVNIWATKVSSSAAITVFASSFVISNLLSYYMSKH